MYSFRFAISTSPMLFGPKYFLSTNRHTIEVWVVGYRCTHVGLAIPLRSRLRLRYMCPIPDPTGSVAISPQVSFVASSFFSSTRTASHSLAMDAPTDAGPSVANRPVFAPAGVTSSSAVSIAVEKYHELSMPSLVYRSHRRQATKRKTTPMTRTTSC